MKYLIDGIIIKTGLTHAHILQVTFYVEISSKLKSIFFYFTQIIQVSDKHFTNIRKVKE